MPTLKLAMVRKSDPPPFYHEAHAGVIEITDDMPINIALLEGGMESGGHAVTMSVDLPDGRAVFFQTSLKLWEQATAAFRGAAQRWAEVPE